VGGWEIATRAWASVSSKRGSEPIEGDSGGQTGAEQDVRREPDLREKGLATQILSGQSAIVRIIHE